MERRHLNLASTSYLKTSEWGVKGPQGLASEKKLPSRLREMLMWRWLVRTKLLRCGGRTLIPKLQSIKSLIKTEHESVMDRRWAIGYCGGEFGTLWLDFFPVEFVYACIYVCMYFFCFVFNIYECCVWYLFSYVFICLFVICLDNLSIFFVQ